MAMGAFSESIFRKSLAYGCTLGLVRLVFGEEGRDDETYYYPFLSSASKVVDLYIARL